MEFIGAYVDTFLIVLVVVVAVGVFLAGRSAVPIALVGVGAVVFVAVPAVLGLIGGIDAGSVAFVVVFLGLVWVLMMAGG